MSMADPTSTDTFVLIGPLLAQVGLRERLTAIAARLRARRAVAGAPPTGNRVVQLMYMVQDRGGEAVAHQLAQGFRERGCRTHNIGVYRETVAATTTADFEILYKSRPSPLGNIGCFVRLVRTLRRERPAALLMHGDFAQVLGAPAAVLAGVRKRIAINHLALGTNRKRLRSVHAILGTLGFYRHIVFVGESARRSADRLPKPFLDRTVVIPNTVSIATGDRAKARRRFDLPLDAIVFLNVGSLTHQKNQQLLIEAMAKVPDAILVIAGSGPLEDEYRAVAADYRNRVRFIGRLPIDEMGEVYALADAFVFPSRFEGRPLALLEAAACGLPILATPIPENIEVLGSAAHYIAVDDVDEWVVAMRRVVDDGRFRQQLEERVARVDLGATDETIESYLNLMS